MSAIVDIIGREVLDSRGSPTVECDVLLESGVMGRAAMPSSTSTGSCEAIELHGGDKLRCLGKGVLRAVEHINTETSEAIMNLDASEQTFLDRTLIDLDSTKNKNRLGANAMLTVSMAVTRAAAEEAGLPLYRCFGGSDAMQIPAPMINIVDDDTHANGSLDIQEFMVIPVDQSSFHGALHCGAEIFHALKKILADEGMNAAVGNESNFAPSFASNEECLNAILSTTKQAGYKTGEDVLLALDCAASGFYKDGKYHLEGENLQLPSEDSANYLVNLANKFPIVSVEDGIRKSDWAGWKALTEELDKKVQLVGDNLFVMNTKVLKRSTKKGIADSILIRINQIGTLTETLAAIEMAKRADYTAVISHHSGKTEDNTIADIAVGTNAGQIKTDSLSRSGRIVKYSRLLCIEEDLGDIASYLGKSAFYNLR